MSRCEDCGCRLSSSGVCSNCHEELYILEEQAEFVERVSPEFQTKAEEQKRKIEEARKGKKGVEDAA